MKPTTITKKHLQIEFDITHEIYIQLGSIVDLTVDIQYSFEYEFFSGYNELYWKNNEWLSGKIRFSE